MDSTPPAALVASRSTQVQPIPPQPEWQCSHLITFSMEHVMPVICSCFLEFTPAHFPLVVLDYLTLWQTSQWYAAKDHYSILHSCFLVCSMYLLMPAPRMTSLPCSR